MKLHRHEWTTLVAPVVVLVIAWIVSAAFTMISGDRVRISLFVSQGYGPMQTDTLHTVWNSTAGTISFSVFASVVFGAYLMSHFRTYLGAGMTRRDTYVRLAVIGLLATALLTAASGVFWGLSTLFEMPEISGVSPLALLTIPVGQLVAYSVGAFGASLFVRFDWWKVVVAVIAIQVVITGGSALINRYVHPFAIDLNQAQTLGILLAVIAVAWIGTWPTLRALPMRRS